MAFKDSYLEGTCQCFSAHEARFTDEVQVAPREAQLISWPEYLKLTANELTDVRFGSSLAEDGEVSCNRGVYEHNFITEIHKGRVAELHIVSKKT